MSEKISQAVIHRLPRYYRYLEEVEARGIDKVSSSQMSVDMNLNASQIRRDLNCFGGFGQQGYGYSVSRLRSEMAHILGLDRRYNVIVVGAGRIGQALVGYNSFMLDGFNIIEVFDKDPRKIGKDLNGRVVRNIAELDACMAKRQADIAVICTPKEVAQYTADLLIKCGVRAIWNFAPIDVSARQGVSVENVHLSDSLYILSYKMGSHIVARDEE